MNFLVEPNLYLVNGPGCSDCPDHGCPPDSNCPDYGIPTPQ